MYHFVISIQNPVSFIFYFFFYEEVRVGSFFVTSFVDCMIHLLMGESLQQKRTLCSSSWLQKMRKKKKVTGNLSF